jgi:hypothetical protein
MALEAHWRNEVEEEKGSAEEDECHKFTMIFSHVVIAGSKFRFLPFFTRSLPGHIHNKSIVSERLSRSRQNKKSEQNPLRT